MIPLQHRPARPIAHLTLNWQCHYPEGFSFAKAPVDVTEQGTHFEWLSEKTQGTSRCRLLVQMLVGQSRNKDHRSHYALFAERMEQVKAPHPRHVNVGNNAVQAKSVWGRQERLRRDERLGAIAD
jgi:hypothetical protein